ncbi:MAG: hypothetical protein AVDCRST_MAG54-4186, partial [uncultured Actinomycetospora sp.]
GTTSRRCGARVRPGDVRRRACPGRPDVGGRGDPGRRGCLV